MTRRVKTETMKDGRKVKFTIDDGEPDTIEQEIVRVFNHEVMVMSRGGNVYTVKLSDKVKMTMKPKPKDIAVIRTFKNGWLVVDLIIHDDKPTDESAVVDTLEKLERRRNRYELEGATQDEWDKLENDIKLEEEKELQKQLKEMEDLLGGY